MSTRHDRREWLDAEVEFLTALYPIWTGEQLARLFGRSLSCIHQKAARLGLKAWSEPRRAAASRKAEPAQVPAIEAPSPIVEPPAPAIETPAADVIAAAPAPEPELATAGALFPARLFAAPPAAPQGDPADRREVLDVVTSPRGTKITYRLPSGGIVTRHTMK